MFEVGQQVSIFLGGAVAHSAVFVEHAHVEVVAVSDKAVRFKNARGTPCWFPKKALTLRSTGTFELARWFRGDLYQRRFLEKSTEVSGQSAAWIDKRDRAERPTTPQSIDF